MRWSELSPRGLIAARDAVDFHTLADDDKREVSLWLAVRLGEALDEIEWRDTQSAPVADHDADFGEHIPRAEPDAMTAYLESERFAEGGSA